MTTARQASEHDEQVALMRWWKLFSATKGIPEQLFFAIPNGGRRDYVTGRKLKEEGARAGVPDLFLAVPSGLCHGLFIEMKKTVGGTLSKEQKEFLGLLEERGFAAVACHGFAKAKEAVCAYLSTSC